MRSKRSSLGRLTKDARNAREKRKRETKEQRQLRLQKHRQRSFAARQAETAEQRQARLLTQKQRTTAYRESLKKKRIQEQCLEEQHLKKQHLQYRMLKNQQSYDRRQMDSTLSSQKTAKYMQSTSQMPVQQDTSVAQALQNIIKPVQASPIQITPSKSKPVKNPIQTTVSKSLTRKILSLKQKLVVADHQRCVMANLVSMWRSKKLCDASISNGSSTVMVHKIVLSAVSPKLFSVFSTYILSQKFFEIKFPEVVSTEALTAFAEYMYTGLLDLDPDMLHQLKIIAKQLDMRNLQNLCDIHLLSTAHQHPASTATVFDDLNQMQSYLSSPANKKATTVQTSSPLTPISTKFVTAVPPDAIDVKQEISENELGQLKEDTAGVFEQEFEAASLDTKSGNSPICSVIPPTVKIEPVGPEDDKYGQLNNESYTSTAVSINSQTPSTTLNSMAVSTTEFSLPFLNTTYSNTTTNVIHGISSKLKSNVFESSLVSDLSPVSCCLSSPIREDPSKPLNRTITTQSIDNIVISGSNEGVYPVGLFTAGGDSLPLSSTQVTNVKNVSLYKTNDLT